LNLKELKDAFDLFDADRSGTISAKELQKVMKAMEINCSKQEIEDLMRLMDADGSGSIDFDEFW
jgi:Ca2+-binding EF-hand superfamily protein